MKQIINHYFKSNEVDSILRYIDKEEFYKSYKEKCNLIKTSLVSEFINDENQIKLKMTSFINEKLKNTVFFSKKIDTIIFVYKKNNGIFYFGNYTKPFRKKKVVGQIRTFPNNFQLSSFVGSLRRVEHMLQLTDYKNLLGNSLLNIFHKNVDEFKHDVLNFIEYGEYKLRLDHFSFLLRMKSMNIKIPDNWTSFSNMSFNKVIAKKNNYNLCNIFLSKHDPKKSIYSKKYKKQLNTINFIPIEMRFIRQNLYNLKLVVGENLYKDYSLEELKEELFFGYTPITSYNYFGIINDRDRLNIHKFIKECISQNSSKINTLMDHTALIYQLHKKLGRSPRFVFATLEKYDEEHYEMSTLLEKLNNGNVIREYPKSMSDTLNGKLLDYNLKLLTTTAEYIEESTIQRNCVKTYTKYKDNFIISLRDNKNRITIEYKFFNGKPKRVQTFGFANSNVDLDLYGKALELLDRKVKDYFEDNTDFEYSIIEQQIINEFHKYTSVEKINLKNLEFDESCYTFEEENLIFQII